MNIVKMHPALGNQILSVVQKHLPFNLFGVDALQIKVLVTKTHHYSNRDRKRPDRGLQALLNRLPLHLKGTFVR